MKKLIKVFSFIYGLFVIVETVAVIFYLPKISINNYQTFLSNNYIHFFYNGLIFIVSLVLVIGVYTFNDLARRILVIRYQLFFGFLVVQNFLAYFLYSDIFRYNLYYLIASIIGSIECLIIIFIFDNKKVKTLYSATKISKKNKIILILVITSFFVLSGFVRLDRALKTYKEEKSYNNAYSYYDKKDYKNALTGFLNSITFGPKHRVIDAAYKTGNCYYYLKDYSQARKYYQKVLEYDNQNVDAYIAIAYTYFFEESSDLNSAIKYLNKALEINPNNIEAKERLEYISKIRGHST